mmetsp:Transcript_4362/g.11628  ORF Transcript_4362/g.11628 Transcript_4362/m.11628 type:complete len:241 (+) Transcript_4362:66-788(+)
MKVPTRTAAKPAPCMGTTRSESSTTPPRIVSTIFSCATICDPTAPRPATTRSCERFSTTAGTLDSATETASPPREGPPSNRWTGAWPSACKDHANISIAEGRDIQARSEQGSNLSRCAPLSIFCCSEALAARRRLLSTARARPAPENCTSPREQRTQPRTTMQVGKSSQRSKCMPSAMTMGTDMMGCVAIRISVSATEQSSRTLLPTPMQVAKQIAMGRIVRLKSSALGTGTATPPRKRR